MKAYEGNENYIFISYAHADSKTVIPIVEVLQSAGFRVWYDLGIEAGTEWPAYIEDHLNKCARIIAFISPSAVESVNCRNEINYALMKKKDMLVVYLENTELKYGLSLQLNAIQSLYKNRHQTTKTFYEELINARLLQCCKVGSPKDNFRIPNEPINGGGRNNNGNRNGGTTPHESFESALRSGNRTRIKASRADSPAIISTVGTIPSNDASKPWPVGTYSQIIDEDKFGVIHFHCRFIRAVTQSVNKNIGLMIFDNEDNLVFDNRIPLHFEPNHDRFSLCWVIAESAGLKQKTGDYTAIIWVDDSRIFEYSFRIISSKGLNINNSTPVPPPPPKYGNNNSFSNNNSFTNGELEKLKNKLLWPKLARRHCLTSFLGIISLALLSESYGEAATILFGLLFLAGTVWGYVTTWKLSRQTMISNGLANVLVMTIGYAYYGMFLIGAGIWTVLNKARWRARIIQLERGIN